MYSIIGKALFLNALSKRFPARTQPPTPGQVLQESTDELLTMIAKRSHRRMLEVFDDLDRRRAQR